MLNLKAIMAQRATELATAKQSTSQYFSPREYLDKPVSFRFVEVSDPIDCIFENNKIRESETPTSKGHKCKIVCNGEAMSWDVYASKFTQIIDSCITNDIDPETDFALLVSAGSKNRGYNYTARKSIFDFDISDKIVELPNSNHIEKSNDRMVEVAKIEMTKMRDFASQSIKASNPQIISPEAPQAIAPTQSISAQTSPIEGFKSGVIQGLNIPSEIPSAPTTPAPVIHQNQSEPKHVQVARMIWSEAGYDARPQMQKYTTNLCMWLEKMLSPELLVMTGDPSDELGTAIRDYLGGMVAKLSLMDATGGDTNTIPTEVHSGITRLVMTQAA